jgi:hypothetical protein
LILRPTSTLLTIGLLCTLSCTVGPDDSYIHSAGHLEGFFLARTDPPAGQVGVPTNTTIDLFFNVFPAAETVVAAHLRVFSGLIESHGTLKVDLLRKQIRFTPSDALQNNTRYRVFLHRDLMGINGATLQQHQVFEFTTGSRIRHSPSPVPPPVHAPSVQEIWKQSQCLHCHGAPSFVAGVDLSTVQSSIDSLKEVPSGFNQTLRVVPFDHSRSYLMLKLLGRGGYIGFSMPPSGPLLSLSSLKTITSWIDAGACE